MAGHREIELRNAQRRQMFGVLAGGVCLVLSAGAARAGTVDIRPHAKRSGDVVRVSMRATVTGSFTLNGVTVASLNINNKTLGSIDVPIDGKSVSLARNVQGVRLVARCRLTNGRIEVKFRGIMPNGSTIFRLTKRVTIVG